MKNKRHFILIFCLFWAIGLIGGYYLGVGSAILPTENIEYNFYFSENSNDSDVEIIKTECSEELLKEDEGTIKTLFQNLNLHSLPQKVLQHFFSPSACNQHHLIKEVNQEFA